MQPVNNKVAAATGAAASVTTPGVLILWVLALLHVPGISMPPPELVGMALGALAASGSALAAGYLKRELNLPAEPPAQ